MTSGIDLFFTTQFLCKHNATDLVFNQVVDLEWELTLDPFYFNITNNMTSYFRFDSVDLQVLGFSNTTEDIALFKLKKVFLPVANRVIKKELNKAFVDGPVPIGDFLESHGLGILNLSQMETWA